MTEPTVPIACTLSSEELPDRLGEFRDLFAGHLRAVERPGPRRLHLILGGGEDVEAATRDLLRREQECCAFYTFTVTRDGAELVVDAEVPAGAEPVLDELAGLIARRT